MPIEGTSRFPDTRNQRMALNHENPLRSEGDSRCTAPDEVCVPRERRSVGRGRIC